MLTKYCKLVREYVALKQDAMKDDMHKLQALNNIMTLNQSFINDIHMLMPKQQQSAPQQRVAQPAPLQQ